MQRGQTYQSYALTLKNDMMFKKDLKCKCCLFFFWGLLISVVILTSFSNYSRRFYLDLYFSWRFMICCWFQMKLQICHVLLWTLFCLFVYLFGSCFFCLNVLGKKRVLPPVSVLRWLPVPPPIPFFNVIVHINQGADQLNTKLSTRSKALKSALEEKTLKKCSWI